MRLFTFVFRLSVVQAKSTIRLLSGELVITESATALPPGLWGNACGIVPIDYSF
jgi:hypothetical protein